MKKVYLLKITLKGIKPHIWRKVKISSEVSLEYLHEVIQIVMGWENSHLWQFIAEGENYGIPDEDSEDMIEADLVKLSSLLNTIDSKITYIYDFGDNWEHDILLEEIIEDEEIDIPICTKGRRACPPEDCGGPWGYQNFINVLKKPKHPEYQEMKEWIGPNFDFEHFNIKNANKDLQDLGVE